MLVIEQPCLYKTEVKHKRIYRVVQEGESASHGQPEVVSGQRRKRLANWYGRESKLSGGQGKKNSR